MLFNDIKIYWSKILYPNKNQQVLLCNILIKNLKIKYLHDALKNYMESFQAIKRQSTV